MNLDTSLMAHKARVMEGRTFRFDEVWWLIIECILFSFRSFSDLVHPVRIYLVVRCFEPNVPTT